MDTPNSFALSFSYKVTWLLDYLKPRRDDALGNGQQVLRGKIHQEVRKTNVKVCSPHSEQVFEEHVVSGL